MKSSKKIITICSSLSFFNETFQIEQELKKLGYKVLIPYGMKIIREKGYLSADDFKRTIDYEDKGKFISKHFKKIIKGDAILVLNLEKNNIKGYVGGNTLMEMAIAFHNKKKIFIFNSISEDIQFREEILGINPKFINKDLTQIA